MSSMPATATRPRSTSSTLRTRSALCCGRPSPAMAPPTGEPPPPHAPLPPVSHRTACPPSLQ
eukprot:5178790-Prymnesium_polylepis.1